MSSNWFHRWLRGNSTSNREARIAIRRLTRLQLLHLEDRALPSTATWDGGGITNNWLEAKNWVGDVAPVAGDNLVFPTGAANLTSFNNFPDGTSFNSIAMSGSGYTISGAAIDLGAGGMISSANSGINRFTGAIQLDGQRTINVASGGTLELSGVLSGNGGFDKTSTGTLTLNGPGANTYTGLTKIEGGFVQLDKGDATGWSIAIPGDLDIHASNVKTEVKLARDNQIADTANVSVTHSPSAGAGFNLNGFTDAIGALNITGSGVETRRFDSLGGIASLGLLTLNGDVTAQAVQLATGTFLEASIDGRIALASTRTFTVNDQPGSDVDLRVAAIVDGDTLRKEGAGQMLLVNPSLQLEVNDGTLFFNGGGQSSATLRNDGVLAGHARLTGSVSTVGGAASTLDDDIRAGFTAGTGWNKVVGRSFGDSFTRTGPAGTSTPTAASWVFTGLKPGLYRVFATWPGSTSNSTKVLYNIFDGPSFRTTAFANQELAPAGGPRDGGVPFQQLAGVVQIISGTLRVQVTNQVAAETDGANVIADAIRIERLAGTLAPGEYAGFTDDLRAAGITLGLGSTYQVDLTTTTADRLDVTGSFVSSGALLTLSSTSFTPPTAGTAYRIVNNGTGSPGTFSNLPNNGDIISLLAGGQRHFFSINYAAGDGNDVDLIYQNTGTQVSNLTLSPDVINEGQRVTLRGALTDPNKGDVLSLRVDWGDGAVQTFTDLGTRPFRFTHTYADNSPPDSPYLVRVEWSDQHGDGNFRKLYVTVNNVPPRLFLGGAEVVRTGDVMHHAGYLTDPGADTWTATVDYGDGSGAQPLTVQPDGTFHFVHRYHWRGTYRVTVTVLDDDGGLRTGDFLVTVRR